MVRSLFGLLGSEIRSIHHAAYLLGFFAILSQVLALARDRTFAHLFGAGDTLDVYYAAFRVPDLVFALVASLMSVYVVLPYLEREWSKGENAARDFLRELFTAFVLVMGVVCVVVALYVPEIVSALFPGITGDARTELILLTRILLAQPFLLGVSNLFGAVVQAKQRFVIYGAAPLLYNVGIIFGAAALYPAMGMIGLGAGVLLGASMHMALQLGFAAHEGFGPLPRMTFHFQRLLAIVATALPRTLTLSAQQLVLAALLGMASVLASGSLSVFSLAFNLQAVPLSVIGVSYSVAAFPVLARLYSNGERTRFHQQITTAAKHILFWSLPLVALFVVLRAHIVRVVLGTGAFDWGDTMLTAAVLALLVLSLPAQALVVLFVRGCYAQGSTWKPLAINLLSSLIVLLTATTLTVVFARDESFRSGLEGLMRVSGLDGTAVLVLAGAYSIGLLVNALLLVLFFEKGFGTFSRALVPVCARGIVASFLAGLVAYIVLNIFGPILPTDSFLGILTQGLLGGLAGIGTALAVLLASGSPELKEIVQSDAVRRVHAVVIRHISL